MQASFFGWEVLPSFGSNVNQGWLLFGRFGCLRNSPIILRSSAAIGMLEAGWLLACLPACLALFCRFRCVGGSAVLWIGLLCLLVKCKSCVVICALYYSSTQGNVSKEVKIVSR